MVSPESLRAWISVASKESRGELQRTNESVRKRVKVQGEYKEELGPKGIGELNSMINLEKFWQI